MIPEELSIQSIEKVYKKIKPYINVTPLIKANQIVDEDLNTNVYLKYECFQKSGSFKARGAINNILSADKKDLKNGITAVSAGNHAIAASYVANIFNLKNKLFLYESANTYRVNQCKNYNANILFTNKNKAFDEVKNAEKEGYKFVHPFDGINTLQGSATLGLEIINQMKNINTKIDNVLISVGGGGLIAGIGAYLNKVLPNVKIIGVEAADSAGLHASISAGKRVKLKEVGLFADGAAAKQIGKNNYELIKNFLDDSITLL